MKKRILAILCAGLMIAGILAGCASGPAANPDANTGAPGQSSPAGKTGTDGKTALNILWWGSQTRHELTTAMLEKFQELNPDIEVVMDYSDWDGYWTKLPAQVAGGQTPDVFQMDYSKLSQYVDNGVLAELDGYVADWI